MAKTLRSRIATVAVAALALGFFQGAPAFASSGNTDWQDSGSYVQGALADGTAGICYSPRNADAFQETTSSVAYYVPETDGQTLNGIMRADGTFALKPLTNVDSDTRFTVSGGTISGYTAGADTATVDSLNSSRTILTINTTSSDNGPVVRFSPSGTGVMQIKALNGDYSGGVWTTSSVAAIWNITVATSCVGYAFSPTYSAVSLVSTDSGVSATDEPRANFADNGKSAYIYITLKDAYAQGLVSGLLTVSATGDATVGFGDVGDYSTAFSDVSLNGSTQYVYVSQSTPGKPVTTTVTIQYNGTTIGTKTVTIRGTLAKLEVTDEVVGKAGRSTGSEDNAYAELAGLSAYDSAGNTLDTRNYSFSFTGTGAQIPSASVWDYSTTYRYGRVTWECGIVGAGSAKLKVSATSETGSTVTSNEFTAACASSPYKYTATLDKKEYAPGDVATLTITAVDSKGNPVYDATTAESVNPDGVNYLGTYYYDDETGFAAWLDDSDANKLDADKWVVDNTPVISGGPLKAVVDAKSSDYFVSGKKTYTFVVQPGQAGNFNLVVNLPKYNSTATGQSAVTVAYSVKAGAADPTITALATLVGQQMTALQTSITLMMTTFTNAITKLLKALAKKK